MASQISTRKTRWNEPARSGASAPVRFVAEVSSNHHTDLDRCLAFIDRAAAIGCDAVKFQLFRVAELFAPEILARSEMHRGRAAWELPTAFLPALAKRSREREIAFACTPFSLRAVAELEPHVDFFKIASYEILWSSLLTACAETGKPLILSTGMATLDEVRRAIATTFAAGCRRLTLLHCVSGYPAPAAEANLSAINTLRSLADEFPGLLLDCGWSDHTVEAGVIHRAVHRHDARVIEFHLDLDGDGEEFAAGHCWLPDGIGEVIRQIRIGPEADGSGCKAPSKIEMGERLWRADPSDGLRPLRATRIGWAP